MDGVIGDARKDFAPVSPQIEPLSLAEPSSTRAVRSPPASDPANNSCRQAPRQTSGIVVDLRLSIRHRPVTGYASTKQSHAQSICTWSSELNGKKTLTASLRSMNSSPEFADPLLMLYWIGAVHAEKNRIGDGADTIVVSADSP
jgi:hypothetical protein